MNTRPHLISVSQTKLAGMREPDTVNEERGEAVDVIAATSPFRVFRQLSAQRSGATSSIWVPLSAWLQHQALARFMPKSHGTGTAAANIEQGRNDAGQCRAFSRVQTNK